MPALGTALLVAVQPIGASAQESPGLRLDATYTADLLSNVRGGVRTGTAVLGNLDATARLSLGELIGWDGTRLFVYVLGNHGGEPSSLAGDAQVVSNIQAPSAVRLYEAWIERDFPKAGISVLFGLYDLNSEFDVLPGADLFLNSSFGIGAEFAASGVNGPSIFPVTSLALRGTWRPSPSVYARTAVLDGVPGDPSEPGETAIRFSSREGALIVAEVGWIAWRSGEGSRRRDEGPRTHGAVGRRAASEGVDAKVAVGIWGYTRRSRALDPDREGERIRGRPGAYLLAEWNPLAGAGASAGRLVLSGRVGFADPRTNRFVAYTGASAVYRGLLPARPEDELGLGVAAAHDGHPFRESRREAGRRAGRTETAIELTYRIQGDSWALQPDLQYVVQPDADPRVPDALVLGMRGEITLF